MQIDEPDVARCCDMLRGILGPMEKHHKVRISDAAIVAAVQLSSRYIPARQLPDKAVSLLDTASARVAISQSATPAMIEDARVAITAREAEKAALVSDSDLGVDDKERIAAIDTEIAALKDKLAESGRRVGVRAKAGRRDSQPARNPQSRAAGENGERGRAIGRWQTGGAGAGCGERCRSAIESEDTRAQLREKFTTLEARDPEKRMIYAACRRTGRRLGGVGLDRHSGRPDGEGRDRDHPQPARNPQSTRRRPVAWAAR